MTKTNFPPQLFSKKNAVISQDDRPNFTFKENGKKYNAQNHNKLIGCCLQIDGKLYDSKDGKKCDKGLLLEDNRFFLIELKGKDVGYACKQILKTLELLNKDCANEKFDFYCRIVGAKGVPQYNKYRCKLETKLQSTIKNRKFISETNSYSEKI